MKRIHTSPFLWLVIAAMLTGSRAYPADPIPPKLQNVVAQQRPGTMMVDVTYDLIDPDSASVHVLMEASMDGGKTYGIPTGSAAGDVGLVTPGTSKRIRWNAWNDWAGNYTTNAQVRLVADDTASLKPAAPFTAPHTNLVWISSGSFDMSGTKVYLSQGFWMSKHEVTQAEYQAVQNSNPSRFRGSQLPVDSVTWNDAIAYCAALTTQERMANRLQPGWTYRLPTEAEWEYACRAGTTTRFSFGDDPSETRIDSYVWWEGNAEDQSHEVGTKGPNRWGLYDMHGNLWEWCSDWYDSLPKGNITDPKGPPSGSHRVIRGGGWNSGAHKVVSAHRLAWDATSRDIDQGFRVVLAPIQ